MTPYVIKNCFFSTLDQSRHLHIGPTLVAETEGLGMYWRNLQKRQTQLSQTQNILENIFEKGELRTAHRISKNTERRSNFYQS